MFLERESPRSTVSSSPRCIRLRRRPRTWNLAIRLLNDAWRNEYECAVIVSNDSDLAEALRLAKQDHKKRLIDVVPGSKGLRHPNNELKRWCAAAFNRKPTDLGACQLPDLVLGTNIHKPQVW